MECGAGFANHSVSDGVAFDGARLAAPGARELFSKLRRSPRASVRAK